MAGPGWSWYEVRVGATRFWARVVLRNHWRAALLLGVLCGFAAGAAGAGWATARATSRAFPDFVAAHRTSDFGVYLCEHGQRLNAACARSIPTDAQRETIAGVPGVAHVARVSAVVGQLHVAGHDQLMFVYTFADRPPKLPDGLLLSGATAVPARPGDVVVNESAAKQLGVRAGEHVTFTPYLEDQQGAADNAGAAQGPPLEGTVVGVVRQPGDLTANARGANQASIAMYVPREWWNQGSTFYRYGVLSSVWLDPGARPSVVKRGIADAVQPSRPSFEPVDLVDASTVDDAIDFEVWAARAFAIVVALLRAAPPGSSGHPPGPARE